MCSLTDWTREFQDLGVYAAEVQQRLFYATNLTFFVYCESTCEHRLDARFFVFVDELDLSYKC